MQLLLVLLLGASPTWCMSLMQADQDRSSMELRQQQILRNQELEVFGTRRRYEIPGLPRNPNTRYQSYNYDSNQPRRRDPSLGWLPAIADWVRPGVENLARGSYVPPYRYNANSRDTGYYRSTGYDNYNRVGGRSNPAMNSADRRRLGWMREDEQDPRAYEQRPVESFRRDASSYRRQDGFNSYDNYNEYNSNYDGYNNNQESFYNEDVRGNNGESYEAGGRPVRPSAGPYLSGSGTTSMDRTMMGTSAQDPLGMSAQDPLGMSAQDQQPSTVVRRRGSASPNKSTYSSDVSAGGSLRDFGGSSRGGGYLDNAARLRGLSRNENSAGQEILGGGGVVSFPIFDNKVGSVKIALQATEIGVPIDVVVEIWREMATGSSIQLDEIYLQDNFERDIFETVIDLPRPNEYDYKDNDSSFSIAIRNVGRPEDTVYARVTPYSGRNNNNLLRRFSSKSNSNRYNNQYGNNDYNDNRRNNIGRSPRLYDNNSYNRNDNYSTRRYNPSDSTRRYNPNDSTRRYNPNDSTRGYNPNDSPRRYNPSDSIRRYNPNDYNRNYGRNQDDRRDYDDYDNRRFDQDYGYDSRNNYGRPNDRPSPSDYNSNNYYNSGRGSPYEGRRGGSYGGPGRSGQDQYW